MHERSNKTFDLEEGHAEFSRCDGNSWPPNDSIAGSNNSQRSSCNSCFFLCWFQRQSIRSSILWFFPGFWHSSFEGHADQGSLHRKAWEWASVWQQLQSGKAPHLPHWCWRGDQWMGSRHSWHRWNSANARRWQANIANSATAGIWWQRSWL